MKIDYMLPFISTTASLPQPILCLVASACCRSTKSRLKTTTANTSIAIFCTHHWCRVNKGTQLMQKASRKLLGMWDCWRGFILWRGPAITRNGEGQGLERDRREDIKFQNLHLMYKGTHATLYQLDQRL